MVDDGFGGRWACLRRRHLRGPTGINLYFSAQGDSSEVFVILIDGAFTVNGAITSWLENGAQASNIYWIVEDATAAIGVGSSGIA